MTYAVCILWTLAVALWAAADDAERIALGERIHHVRSWLIRAALVAVVCVAAEMPLMVVPMGALFSMVFRFTLNDVRELDWRYVSPSSWYDWQFLRITLFDGFNSKVQDPIQYHREFYIPTGRNDQYQWAVHRAGLLAYIVEAVVLALTILLV